MSNCAKDSYFQFINTASPQVSSQPSIFLVHLLSHFLGLLFHTFSLSSHIPNTPHSQLTELNFLRKEVSIFPPDPGRGWCKILSKSCLYTWLTCPAPLSCTHSSEALISVVDAILVKCPACNSQFPLPDCSTESVMIDHSFVLEPFPSLGNEGIIFSWFFSWLIGRTFPVSIAGSSFSWGPKLAYLRVQFFFLRSSTHTPLVSSSILLALQNTSIRRLSIYL